MLYIAVRNLVAHKVRFAMTTMAVVLGVSFIVASFVLTDGLRLSFRSLTDGLVSGADLHVEPDDVFGAPSEVDALTESLVADAPGVRVAMGTLSEREIQPVTVAGTPVSSDGAPLIGNAWIEDPQLSRLTIVEGRAPQPGAEFTMDAASADEYSFVVGNIYEVLTPSGSTELALVGLSRLGEGGETLGPVMTQYHMNTARELFDRPSGYDSLLVAVDDSADPAQVRSVIERTMPEGLVILGREEVVEEVNAGWDSQVGTFGNVLLGFAVVALFVSVFTIVNTFSIVVGQRTRELGLLRALGAQARQVLLITTLEALVVGLVATVLGVGGGLALNRGLRSIFRATGAGLPDGPSPLAPRTVVVAVIVGVGVTVLSSIGPARRAAGTTPMAAIRDIPPRVTQRNKILIAGCLLSLGGATMGVTGLFTNFVSGGGRVGLIGFATAAVFVGIALLGPSIVAPVLGVIGAPGRILGVPSELATENGRRQPRRTSTTAAALMVGLTLVTTTLVIGESVKSGLATTFSDSVRADFVIDPDGKVPTGMLDRIGTLDEVQTVAGFRYEQIRIDGEVHTIVGADLLATSEVFAVDVTSGSLTNDPDLFAISSAQAVSAGWHVGDSVEVEFPTGETEQLIIGAIFESDFVLEEDYLITNHDWSRRFTEEADDWAVIKTAGGASVEEARTAIEDVAVEYKQVEIQDRTGYRESFESEIDSMLVVINALLALTILIAGLGIANTLALSVFERTREIGLLRAVGMTRSQVRHMVVTESVLIAFFGALQGIALGLVFGAGITLVLPDSLSAQPTVPFGRLAVLVVLCALIGMAAAVFPARRAGRLDVLQAIAEP